MGQQVEGRNAVSWPEQGEMTRADLRLWRRTLLQANGVMDESLLKRLVKDDNPPRLTRQLGPWKSDFRTGWEYCSATKTLFETATKTKWMCESTRATRQGRLMFGVPTTYQNIFPVTSPAKVKMIDGKVVLIGWGERERPNPTTTYDTFRLHLNQSEKKEKWLWEHSEWDDEEDWEEDGDILSSAIQNGTALAISDGTLKEKRGAAAAVLEGDTREGRVKLWSVTSGEEDQQSSYRSKLTGLLMIVSFVEELVQFKGLQNGMIRVGCDGEAAVDN
jgi:hypothetical protein